MSVIKGISIMMLNFFGLNKKFLVVVLLCAIFFFSFFGSIVRSEENRGVISITFDDGTRNQYTVAFPIMQNRSIVGTFYIPTDVPNDTYNQFNQITPSELLEMQSAGNEIGSHGVTHSDFNTLTEQQIRNECANSKVTLESYGLTVNNFAYPFGTGDLNYEDTIISQYYLSSRIVFYAPMTISNHPFQLPAINSESSGVEYTNLLPTLKNAIDQTVNNNEWSIFYIHNVVGSQTAIDYGGISVDDFAAFLDYAKASGVLILTINQALNLSPSPSVTPSPSPSVTPSPMSFCTPSLILL